MSGAAIGWPIAAAFLLGSIPFGAVLARTRGVNLKQVGSGNIGATNVARALGRQAGILVLLLDTAKAYLPTLAARLGYSAAGSTERGHWIAAGVGLAAFVGHIYSPWLRFKGGKGVACGLGVFLALAPRATGCAAAVYLLVVAVTRFSSLGSLLGTVALLPALWLFHQPRAYLVLAAVMLLFIVWRHRANVRRLLRGEENKW
jgi:glycerol-3-phosphate acyltransferase PlsY